MSSSWNTWSGRIQRGLSFRIGFLALLIGGLAGAVASAVAQAAAVPVTIAVWVLAWLAMVMNDSQMVTCDACRKSVKLGASTCHHCGYSRPA